MAEPYSIYKRSSGVYYVQFPYFQNGKIFRKSTGCRTRAEANKKVLEWYAAGALIPETTGFDAGDHQKIIRILKERKIIISCVIPNSKESLDGTFSPFFSIRKLF